MAGEVVSERQARGLHWSYDVGAVPVAQRNLTSGMTTLDIFSATIKVELDRWYAYKFTGSMVVGGVDGVGQLWVRHSGADFALLWYARNDGVATMPVRASGWSRAFKATSDTISLTLRSARVVGTGPIQMMGPTEGVAYGECYLELIDVGRGA